MSGYQKIEISHLGFQLILPTAFDEAGIRMLDSIREIFDIIGIDFESTQFKWIKYNNEKDLVDGIRNGKCPVADVLKSYYSSDTDGSHVMVATGIKEENGVKNIQLKNSFADNPNEQGKVHSLQLNLSFKYRSNRSKSNNPDNHALQRHFLVFRF